MTFHKSVFPLFILTFIFSALPTFAANKPSGVPHREYNENQKNKIAKISVKPTLTPDMLTTKRENATNIGNKIITQLTKRFDYLNTIKLRLQAKIDTLKATKNMTTAQAKLTAYDAATAKYKTDLAALQAQVTAINTSTDLTKIVPTLRHSAKTVETDLQILHRYLIDTLKLIVKAPKL